MAVFSIIVVCKNSGTKLKDSVYSILNQKFKDFEIIIVDSASTDGSLSFLEKIDKHNFKIISEPDNGIYDAMNKGIRNASGNFIFFLNSGDLFFNDLVLENAFNSQSNDFDLIIGNVVFKGAKDESLEMHHLNKVNLFFPGVNHQRIFHNKKLFETIGSYNENFKIAADRDFLFKVLNKSGVKIKHIDTIICTFELGGISTNPRSLDSAVSEQLKLFHIHFNRFQRIIYFLFFNDDFNWPTNWKTFYKLATFKIFKDFRFFLRPYLIGIV